MSLSLSLFFFFFWSQDAACGILVPQPRAESIPQHWKCGQGHFSVAATSRLLRVLQVFISFLIPKSMLCILKHSSARCKFLFLSSSLSSSKPRSPALQADSLPAEPQGSPRILEWVAYPFSSESSPPRN